MRAYEISYDVPGSSGHREVVLADNEEMALENLEKKDPRFKNRGGYYKVHGVKEVSLDQVKVGKLSVSELLMLVK